MLWIPEKSSPRREHLSSPESTSFPQQGQETATLVGGGISGQWVQNLHRNKVATSSHGTWNPGEERTGLSQVALGWRNCKGSGLEAEEHVSLPLISPWMPGLLPPGRG